MKLPPLPLDIPRVGETWEHYKGTCYVIKDVMVDSETLQVRIAYTDGVNPTWDRVLSGVNPITLKPCGWLDPLPDGRPRYTRVSGPETIDEV